MKTRAADLAARRAACWLGLLPLSAGCGAPGAPTAPTPPVAVAVSDLSASQIGDAARLKFTLPTKTLTGDKLTEPPAVEVLRGGLRPDGTPDGASFRVVLTLPGALVASHLRDSQVEILDPVAPEETRSHQGASTVYAVRTRASKKRASANSNAVVLKLYPVPEPIAAPETRVTEPAIELTWKAPSKTSAGDALLFSIGYRVYRGEIEAGSAEAALKDLAQAKWRAPLAFVGPADEGSYRDTGFELGKNNV